MECFCSLALKRTFLLPVFTLSLIGTVLSAYLSAGYRSNVVQFVEVQYGQEPAYASFYTAGKTKRFHNTAILKRKASSVDASNL